MEELISREQVIATIDRFNVFGSRSNQIILELMIRCLPSVHKPLTDEEQRIFLVTMGRERELYKKEDTRHKSDMSPTSVCDEIERKAKKTLWS